MREGTCISCGQGLVSKGSTIFTCAGCDEVIGRCGGCREQAVEFTGACGVAGP